MIVWLATGALAATLTVGEHAPTVQSTIDLAAPGDTVVIPAGDWAGPVRVDEAITLTSTGGVIDGGDQGTVLRVSAPGAVIDGVRVRGSGSDLATTDACVYVESTAVGAVVRGSEIWDCAFGIWVHQARAVRIEDNVVRGRETGHPSNKGNAIHLFDSDELVVRGNTVSDARDGIYVSATNQSLIADNHATRVRWGIHYMYSMDNVIRGNVVADNNGGIALMQSRGLTVEDNVATGNKGRGILFRDAERCSIRRNRVERNGEGLFFYSSIGNDITDNVIAHNQVGARVWAGTKDNVIAGNRFLANRQQVFYVAAEDQVWGTAERGNTWSDYLGWDQDGDGRGDRPYRADSFTANLLYRFPQAVLLLNSPTLEMLSYLQVRMPALRVPTVIDEHPTLARVQ